MSENEMTIEEFVSRYRERRKKFVLRFIEEQNRSKDDLRRQEQEKHNDGVSEEGS